MTIEQIQAMITSGLYPDREIINQLADYLQANPPEAPVGSSYLVCLPIITQSGTDAPTSTNLGDTVGLNSWTRFSAGFYYNLTDADFPADANKVQFIGQTDTFFIPLYSGANTLQGWLKMLATNVGGKIEIELNIKNAAGADTELSDVFSGPLQLPEIRVYP